MNRLSREKIQEVIVVEGRDDLLAVRRAVDAQVIVTQGLGISPETMAVIGRAQERCGVIVFTDPDGPGERIRRWVTEAVPGAKHAFLPAALAKKDGKVGIEHASSQAIREALAQVRSPGTQREMYNRDDLRLWGIDGVPGAGQRREALGERLGIGRTNAKQFLQRVNHFGLSRSEIEQALDAIDGRER